MGPVAIYVASGLATGSAAILAAKRRAHLPVALLLATGLACDLVSIARPPWALGVALGTLYPWAVLVTTWHVLEGCGARTKIAVLVLYALSLVAILASGAHGQTLSQHYAITQCILAMVLVTILAMRKPRRPGATELVAIVCAVTEMACAAGAYASLPGSWVRAQASYMLCYMVITAIQCHALWRNRESR